MWGANSSSISYRDISNLFKLTRAQHQILVIMPPSRLILDQNGELLLSHFIGPHIALIVEEEFNREGSLGVVLDGVPLLIHETIDIPAGADIKHHGRQTTAAR